MTSTFERKVAVITGAGGDIGGAAAALLAEGGAAIVAVDRDATSLDRLAERMPRNTRFLSIAADVGHEAEVKAYVGQATAAFGSIDIFFNNAGIEGGDGGTWRRTTEFPVEAFNKILLVNVTGVFLGMKHVIPIMARGGGGSIVNTCSILGIKGSPGQIGYVASKHAVLGMTRTAAAEWGGAGVRVNCIGPAWIEGRMMDSLIRAATLADSNSPTRPPAAAEPVGVEPPKPNIPLARWATAAEVAPLVAFLASDEAGFITGAFYAIDGGMSAL